MLLLQAAASLGQEVRSPKTQVSTALQLPTDQVGWAHLLALRSVDGPVAGTVDALPSAVLCFRLGDSTGRVV